MNEQIEYVVTTWEPWRGIPQPGQICFFNREDAERIYTLHNAKGEGFYAQLSERPYVPVEHKSNFFGPPVRWDLPPVYCAKLGRPY